MPTSPTPITTAPDVPDRGDRSTFAGRAEAWNDYIKDDFVPELNTLADVTYDNAVEAAASATTATTKAGEADASADAAALSESAAAASAAAAAASYDSFDDRYLGPKASDPTTDNDGGALVTGALYFKTTPTTGLRVYNGTAWVVAGVPGTGMVGPGSSTVDNIPVFDDTTGGVLKDSGVSITGLGNVRYAARTSNTQLVAADKNKLIDITSGTFSQTFAAASALGDGWWCYIRNSGTGDITLEPDGAELIDGLTNFVMYQGEVRLVRCTGSALMSFVIKGFSRTFAASGTFVTPPGYSLIAGLLWGGGGSGGRHGTVAGGGGGGACVPFSLPASSLGASETVTIGAGGTASAGLGNAGGNSTFSVVTAYGGGGGGANNPGGGGGGALSAGTTPSSSPSAGGGPSRGTGTFGNDGFGGGSAATGNASGDSAYGGGGGASGLSAAGSSLYGGGGGGGGAATPGAAGTSRFGGNGGAGADATSATAGTAPGGGGGGCRTVGNSGAGARGELRLWGVI